MARAQLTKARSWEVVDLAHYGTSADSQPDAI